MIKTRFAPSPSGYIHIGNIRTALFCWLYSRKFNGKFFLRIDDTDFNRSSKKYFNNIVDTLHWLGLSYDSDIVFQSKNLNIYKKFLDFLLFKKKIYKCYCSKDRLNFLKTYQISNKFKLGYDRHCRDLSDLSKPFVLRFKNCFDGKMSFNDIVKGSIFFDNSEFDDFIISKGFHSPTYNFASVVDDINLNITHIIRGDDHISNTIKQIKLMNAFEHNIPNFIHLPMILDENKKVLSKRDSKSYFNFYINEGFLPISMLNYLIRLGWSFKDQEIFSLDEMIKFFDFKHISSSPAVVDYKKLLWLNKYYMKKVDLNILLKYFLPIEKKFSINYLKGPSIKNLLLICRFRSNTLLSLILDNLFLFDDKSSLDLNILKKKSFIFVFDVLNNTYLELKSCKFDWSINNIKNFISLIVSKYNFDMFDFCFILRTIITNSDKPNSLYEIFFLCGRILILKKIRNIIKLLHSW